jgi:hypothetical protein
VGARVSLRTGIQHRLRLLADPAPDLRQLPESPLLLRQPGGYEGVRNMQIAFAPNDLPAANSKPERHPSGSARQAVPRLRSSYPDRDHFGSFVTDCLDLDGESARSRVLVAPIRAKTVVSPIGIYPLRRAVELGHPRAAGIPAGKPAFEIPIVPGGQSLANDLDVFLRHRPSSISPRRRLPLFGQRRTTSRALRGSLPGFALRRARSWTRVQAGSIPHREIAAVCGHRGYRTTCGGFAALPTLAETLCVST